MGEYIKYHGQEIKLGTCEDLYYTRLGQLEAAEAVGVLEKIGGNLNPAEYLDPQLGWRYRFPFPEEDNIDMGDFEDYDKGLVIQLQPEDWSLSDFEHIAVWHSCHANHGYNVNVAMPCPQSPEFDNVKHSPMTWRIVAITQQKQVDGEVWTIIDCPYCIGKVRLPKEDALKLVHSIEVGYINQHNQTENNKAYYTEVVKRILDGYTNVEAISISG